MPANIQELIEKAKRFFTDAANNVMAIYAEKGIEPFKKPLFVAVPTLLVLYMAVYIPLEDKIRAASNKLAASQAISQGAGDYEDAKKRLLSFQAKLPPFRDKDDWLNGVLMNSARQNAISFNVFSAQTEEDADAFIVVSRRVEFSAPYETIGKWLADIENSPIFLRIVSMSMVKDVDNPATAKVSLQLSTIFAKAKPSSGGASR